MKNTLLIPLALISLTLTSCGMIRGVDNTCKADTDCKETEMCYFKPEGTVGACIIKPLRPASDNQAAVTIPDPVTFEENPVTPTPTPTNPKNTTKKNTENNPPKADEVKTEDLTKDLDAFVDDITKGL